MQYLTFSLTWLRSFWALVATVLAAAIYFPAAVVNSIALTPHPELVYAIFFTLAVVVALLTRALWRYNQERALLSQMQAQPAAQRAALLQALPWRSEMQEAYDLCNDPRPMDAKVFGQMLDSELDAASVQITSRLSLSGYLGGALVGLGLVGTFIGLLATLEELSNVFAALGGAGGGGDSGALFGSMIEKLQGPMRGMGTAFVASLYGLLGSLLVGLVAHGVRRDADQLIEEVRLFLTKVARDRASDAPLPTAEPTPSGPLDVDGLRQLAVSISADLAEVRRTSAAQIEAASQALATLTTRAEHTAQQLSQGVEEMSMQATLRLQQQTQWVAKLAQFEQGLHTLQASWMKQLQQTGLLTGQRQLRGAIGLFSGAVLILALVLYVGLQSLRSGPGVTPDVPAPQMGPAPSPPSPTSPASGPKAAPGVATPALAQGNAPSPTAKTIVLVQGDTLYELAKRHGVTERDLLNANPEITNPYRLRVGAELTIPSPATSR